MTNRPDLNPTRLYFFGNYLSNSRGSKGPGEFLIDKLKNEGFETHSSSSQENLILRFFDLSFSALFSRADIHVLDLYSGKYFFVALWLSLILALRQRPILLVLHGGNLDKRFEASKTSFKWLFRKTKVAVSPSKRLCEYFSNHGFQVSYLPNPIEKHKYIFNSKSKLSGKLVWIRAFSAIYDPELAILCLSEALKIQPNLTLSMYGPDLGLKDLLKEKYSDLISSKKLRFYNQIPNHQVNKILLENDILLNTPKAESFGMILLEAALSGTAIVSVSVGEVPYLWENGKAMIINRNPIEMANAVCWILDDLSRYKMMSNKAREKGLEFDWTNVLPLWKKHILEFTEN